MTETSEQEQEWVYSPMRCRGCEQPIAVHFYVSDELWNKVVSPETEQEVYCLDCFTVLAAARDVPFTKHDIDRVCPVPSELLRMWLSRAMRKPGEAYDPS